MAAKKEIRLDTEFGSVAWKRDSLEVSTPNKTTKIVVNGVTYTPVNEDAKVSVDPKTAYSVGDSLPDGWVVAGISPTTGKPFSMEPASGALEGYYTWYKGEAHAKKLRKAGNKNARQPDDNELNAIYRNVVNAGRNQNSKLNTRVSDPFGRYWSSTPDPVGADYARLQYLDDGGRDWSYKGYTGARVRVVRDEPGLKPV